MQLTTKAKRQRKTCGIGVMVHLGVQNLQKLAKEELVDGFDYNSLQAIKSEFFCRPRENRKMWHMLTKSTTFIFCSEIPYGESINVVYFFGLNLFSFSRKYSKL